MRIISNQTGEISFNVTQDVLDGATDGWLIRKTIEGQNGEIKLYPKEGAAAANNTLLAPRLILEYGQPD